MSENYIDGQVKAHFFLAKKYSEEVANNLLLTIQGILSEKEKKLLACDVAMFEKVKEIIASIDSDAQIPCFAEEDSVKDSDYPIGTIISVAVACSDIESKMPYMENGIKVNTTLNCIYLNTNQKQGQVFHWFEGKETTDSNFVLMPGVWKSRGICGGFGNEIVGFKYFLAQRVK